MNENNCTDEVNKNYCYWDVNICRARKCININDSDEGNTYYNRSICGNLRVEPGEDCDDGNKSSGDGCSSICLNEPIKYSFSGCTVRGGLGIAFISTHNPWSFTPPTGTSTSSCNLKPNKTRPYFPSVAG